MKEEDKETIRKTWKLIHEILAQQKNIYIVTPEVWKDVVDGIMKLQGDVKRISESRDKWKDKYYRLKREGWKE